MSSTPTSGKWTNREHELFQDGVQLHGWGEWKKISLMIPTRTNKQVKTHAHKILQRENRQRVAQSFSQSSLTAAKNRTPRVATKHVMTKAAPFITGDVKDVDDVTHNEEKRLHSVARNNSEEHIAKREHHGAIQLSVHSADDKTVSYESINQETGNCIKSNGKAMDIEDVLNAIERRYHSSPGKASTSDGILLSTDGATMKTVSSHGALQHMKRSNQSYTRKVSLSPNEPVPKKKSVSFARREEVSSTEKVAAAPALSGNGTSSPPKQLRSSNPTYVSGLLTNYDVLCGSDPAYFHTIGNRRFRIMIEMRIHIYEQIFLATCLPNVMDKEIRMLHYLDGVLQSLKMCNPPCRFLTYDVQASNWRVMDDNYARGMIRETFQKCMAVRKVRFDNLDCDNALSVCRADLLDLKNGSTGGNDQSNGVYAMI